MPSSPRPGPATPLWSRQFLVVALALSLGTAANAASKAAPAGAPAPTPPTPRLRVGEAPFESRPLSPAQALQALHTEEDFEIQQVLAEPIVAQPVFLNFDERGRMWVVQYLQYPDPAGLKPVSHDSSWRTVYDRVPPPPPNHFRGRDKITIHESSRRDGIFDRHKTFVDGLNIVSAVERGRGGVWVLNPPYLLFYPDANNDDVPDGDPIVHLSGFGLEDTHSVVNSLRWGPDGWLYAAQGSTVTAHIVRPGLDREPIAHTLGQQIWRYHPETRRFEVFAEGGGNTFGVEIDAHGRIFSGHNGGNTRGFYYMQGAYEQKGFDKHGPLSNPYAFGYFPPMNHPPVARFVFNFIVYEGGALPARHAGKLFGLEPLQGRVIESEITPDKSSFQTVDVGRPITSDDPWFRPVDIKAGPDGAIYVCDWYDRNVEHTLVQDGKIEAANGRIYALRARGAKPEMPPDLGRLSGPELVEMLGEPNKWVRQTALRVLADRRDRTLVPTLARLVAATTGQRALEALWALNLTGGLDEMTALKCLDHADPFVRLWTVRLLGDEKSVTRPVATKLAALAQTEPNLEARGQLACTARRLPAADGLAIVRGLLARDEDADDNRLPLLLWWAIEANAETGRAAVLALFQDAGLWHRPIVRRHILERVMRRYAQAGRREDLLACAQLFALSPSKEHSQALIAGFEAAFQGRALSGLPVELLAAMSRFDNDSIALGLRQARPDAVARALATIADEGARPAVRIQYLGIVGEAKVPNAAPVLLGVLEKSPQTPLRKAALAALQAYDDAAIGSRVVELFAQFDRDTAAAAQTLLASRTVWSRQWLQALESGRLKAEPVSANLVHALLCSPDAVVARAAEKVWGSRSRPTSVEKQGEMARLARVIREGQGDPYAGRTQFQLHCAACHVLFTQGGQVGPDLTPFKRDDVAALLRSIVDPSAEIREGYEYTVIQTRDGRTLRGFVAERNDQFLMLRGLDGQNTALDRNAILKLEPAGVSLMPEGLLNGRKDQEIRDLFAYLCSSQPLVGKPMTAEEIRLRGGN